jgi:hypothetical protein
MSRDTDSPEVSTLLGEPGGALGSHQDFGGGTPANGLLLRDFDLDGRPDIALSMNGLYPAVVVLPGIPPPPASVDQAQPREQDGLRIVPNPVTSRATIRFRMPTMGHARLEVFDVAGHRVAKAADGFFGAGEHQVLWPGSSNGGNPTPPGFYFLRLTTSSSVSTARFARLAR